MAPPFQLVTGRPPLSTVSLPDGIDAFSSGKFFLFVIPDGVGHDVRAPWLYRLDGNTRHRTESGRGL